MLVSGRLGMFVMLLESTTLTIILIQQSVWSVRFSNSSAVSRDSVKPVTYTANVKYGG